MVNPTGYTALDLIGFTDKDAYSSSENYVKNDLVHYGGNIWRCLIDDTSGIAPSEGVNWTLFIGEPTNLVERIIAPVETDPATSAWAVGRQIIFNDNLYEVITAITAGDALVTYENDPTNANIKLADPVETQLLNLKGNLSNRNLFDNAWFTVNQRGVSTTTAEAYCVDRWYSHSAGNTISSNGVTFTAVRTSIEQPFLASELSLLVGKTVTFSVMLSDGTIVSGTKTFALVTEGYVGSDNIYLYSRYASNEGKLYFAVESRAANITIRAVKLELGTVSTLEMDTIPNYQQELAKCQRYCIALNPSKIAYDFVGQGIAWSNSQATIIIPTPVTMRAKPSITDISKWSLFNPSESAAITSVNVAALSGNSLKIEFNTSSGAVNQGNIYLVSCGSIGDLLLLSADL